MQGVLTISGTLASFMIAGAAVATAVAAWIGLTTWRKQLRARSEHEVARGLLRAALRVRNAIRERRSIFAHPRQVSKQGLEQYRPNEQWAAAVRAELQGLSEAGTEFDAQVLEAETLWGQRAKEACKPLIRTGNSYKSAMYEYYRVHVDNRYNETLTTEKLKEIHAVVWEQSGEEDAFAQKLSAAMRQVEGFARPFLHIRP